jgi:mono/diheme cytochrome c family protein
MPLASILGFSTSRSLAIVGSAAAAALFAAGCGSSGSDSGSGGGGGGSVKQITTATTGKAIFQGANCVSCHVLADAGGRGSIGPNLDEEKPSAAEVVEKVNNGGGSMPQFKKQLTAAQIQTVADYVSQVAGG